MLFSRRKERDYFWVGQSQLVQAWCLVLTTLLLVGISFLRPTSDHPPTVMPVKFTHMQEDFTKRVQELYFPVAPVRLVTPPVLRQILYHNLQSCQPSFLDSHDVNKCNITAKQDVTMYVETLENATDPFHVWNESECGPKPFRANDKYETTGQDYIPSRECEVCFLEPSGYVLQLPYPTSHHSKQPSESFLSNCVAKPLKTWFADNVRNDTYAIISDGIKISDNNDKIERHQIAYERLLPLNMWWASDVPVIFDRRQWLEGLLAFLSFIIFFFQLISSVMELSTGKQYQTIFNRIFRAGHHVILVGLSLAFFIFVCIYKLRWDTMADALKSHPAPPSTTDDMAKQERVKQMYQSFTIYHWHNTILFWNVLALIILQFLLLLTYTDGYLYGVICALRGVMVPLILAMVWAILLVLLAHVFHDSDTADFRDLLTSFRTIFVIKHLEIKHEEEPSVTLLVLLHLTIFLMLPFFLGLMLANLTISMMQRRGGERWWATRQR